MVVDEYTDGGGAHHGGPRMSDIARKYGVNLGTLSRRQVVEGYMEGSMTQRQLAERHGVTVSTVQYWVRQAAMRGIARPDRRETNYRPEGVSYHQALPPEQWPRAERFLALATKAARMSAEYGSRVDGHRLLEAARVLETQHERGEG